MKFADISKKSTGEPSHSLSRRKHTWTNNNGSNEF